MVGPEPSSDAKVESTASFDVQKSETTEAKTERALKDWLQRKNTASFLLKKQATTSRLQDTRIHRHIAQEEPKLQLFLHKFAPINSGGRTTSCRNNFFSTNFQTLGSPCCNWWRSRLSLLSLWIGRQDLHVATLSNLPVASYSFHCWLEKHILVSIFVYMFITCICCLHNPTHSYLYYSILQTVQMCVVYDVNAHLFLFRKTTNATPPKRQEKQTSSTKYLQNPPPISAGAAASERPVVSFHWKVHQEHRSRLRAPKSPGGRIFAGNLRRPEKKNRVSNQKNTSCFKQMCHT